MKNKNYVPEIFLYHRDEKIRNQIDECLRKMSQLNSKLGNNDTEQEKAEASLKTAEWENKIKELDYPFYKRICPDIDEEAMETHAEMIAEFMSKGTPQKELAKKYKLKHNTVSAILTKHLQK